MQRLDIDFQKHRPVWSVAGFLLLVIGIGSVLETLSQYHSLAEELMRSERHLEILQRDAERQRLFAVAQDNHTKKAPPGVLSRSLVQWEILFSGIEAAAGDSVTLLSLDPGPKKISLHGEARDFAAMAKYAHRLSNTSVLDEVQITEHEIAHDHPRRPVRFTLSANWKEGQF